MSTQKPSRDHYINYQVNRSVSNQQILLQIRIGNNYVVADGVSDKCVLSVVGY